MKSVDPDIAHRYRILRQPARVIAQELSMSMDMVYESLRRQGIERDHPGGKSRITEEVRQEIIRLYRSPEKIGATTLAKQFGIDKKSVYNILVKAEVGTRPQSDRKGDTYTMPPTVLAGLAPTGRKRGSGRTNQKALNANAFDVLTDPAAYWIGYLLCDGHITRPAGRSSLRLFLRQGMCHVEHLKAFKAFIAADNEITTGTHKDPAGVEQEHCCLTVTSLHMCETLGRYGLRGLKPTRKAEDPRLLDNPHFWRGCVDADGTLYPEECRMYLSGHTPLLEQWRKLVLKIGQDTVRTTEQPGCLVDNLRVAASLRMIKFLYLDSSGPALADKLAKARSFRT